jgi:hypothetical protein
MIDQFDAVSANYLYGFERFMLQNHRQAKFAVPKGIGLRASAARGEASEGRHFPSISLSIDQSVR